MAKKTNTGELPEPELSIPKAEAKQLLTERINKGKELLVARIFSKKQLDEERKKYYNWNKYNNQLLKRIFSNPKIAEEYSYWIGIVSNIETFEEEEKEHYDDINDHISRLESVFERLELFNEIIRTTNTIKTTSLPKADNKKIFIIHGHDEARLLELEKIIKDDFKLKPIILKDQPDGGATTVIEKFELYAPQCIYAIALFTPDDQVEKDGKKYLQARPNVIYELGWFCAKLTRKNVMLILKEGTDVFSDFQGIIQKRFKDKVTELYRDLHQEFKAAELVSW